ncbi:MAG TPA: DNA repair protein RecN [Bryobacteraceae bacterium]|nr:DNA repair protein RecN [Bryobacteraceae bacterium]HOQ44772.1 DNA repair protein RecN [Bryobacteraceae bacterium]HPU71982.1 DNA repair protein RecN [Bryobacteraceae bacterium]
MLLDLVVENYAVIERVRVRFHPGLNLLTGETGSGKSIIVDALALLFGSRASQESVRSGAARARVSGLFEIPDDERLRQILESAGIEVEDGELLLEREILAEGKSRAFAGSRPITAALLRDLAPFLGDIHGQHDQQMLFSPAAQLEMLDAFAGTGAAVAEAGELYRCWRGVTRELEELDRTEQETLRLLDIWNFQRKEIEAVAPKPGEDAALEQERRVLQNSVRLEEAAGAAWTALYDAPDSAAARLRAAIRKLEELSRIDPRLDSVRESLGPAAIAVEEASYAVRDYLSRLEANPARLEEIENRLAALDRLKRKYGATVEDILAFLDDVRAKIAAVETAGERRQSLEQRRKELAARYQAAADALSARRKEAALELEKRVEAELAALAMERTRFKVLIEPAAWSERGADSVRFLVSPNLGEEPRPLEKVASGGEISRIALALKTCIAGRERPARTSAPRTLVFDEVDAGIGGRAAETVGRRLKQLAASCQVLCVTHLPQIAGFADHHFSVEKRESNGRTVAVIEELTGEARTREIARMLSGERLTREAMKHAEQLLKTGAEA